MYPYFVKIMHVDQIQQNCKNRTHTNPRKMLKQLPSIVHNILNII